MAAIQKNENKEDTIGGKHSTVVFLSLYLKAYDAYLRKQKA